MDQIYITEQFRDYIERLHYEKCRYEDLLKTVRRDMCPMTDEEWDSSMEYFQTLMCEANIRYRAMIDCINETYRPGIRGRDWYVDFRDSAIVCLDKGETPPDPAAAYDDRHQEQYSEQLLRLYPMPPGEEDAALKFNGYSCIDVSFQVTDGCNMACTYCYQHNKGAHRMPLATAKRFVDMLLDADESVNQYADTTRKCGIIFGFIGGEPWLEIDLIAEVSDYILGEMFRRKHPLAIRWMLSICSNGLLHFDDRVQTFLKKHLGHLSYSISIDGDKELHDSCRVDLAGNGTYDRAIAGVKQFREELGGLIGSKMTISPNNVKFVTKAVKSMLDVGYRHINLNCVYEEGWRTEHAAELYWQLHDLVDYVFDAGIQDEVSFSILSDTVGKPLDEASNNNWCGGLGLMLAMDWKGDMYPCIRYMESSVGNNAPPYVIGNINDGLNRLPEHRERVECMNCITRRSQSTDECWNCPIASGCGWCSAYNYECFGTQNRRATYICCMHKARSLACVYYWRRMGKDFPLNCPKEWAVEIIGEEEYERLANMERSGE